MEVCIIVFLKLISAYLNCIPKTKRERQGGMERGGERRERERMEEWDFKDSSNKFGKCQTFYFSWQFRNVFCIFAMEEFSHKGKCSLFCTIFPKQSWEGIREHENSPVQPVEMLVPAPWVFSPPSHERDPWRESWSLIRTKSPFQMPDWVSTWGKGIVCLCFGLGTFPFLRTETHPDPAGFLNWKQMQTYWSREFCYRNWNLVQLFSTWAAHQNGRVF